MLETSRIVYLLQPYYRNYGKRIRKSPKLYLLDPGLALSPGLHTPRTVCRAKSGSPGGDCGGWRMGSLPPDGEQPLLYYWQLSTGAEVDLIIDRGGILYGIEVKATATPTPPTPTGSPAGSS